MKEGPILMNGAMVRAVLEGRKKQTRRTMKNPPTWNAGYMPNGWTWEGKKPGEPSLYKWSDTQKFASELSKCAVCPHGKVGDRLWVRETFFDSTAYKSAPIFSGRKNQIVYRADGESIGCHHWKPSIHMPRGASRILLEITEARAEQLKDISEEDAKLEGVESLRNEGEFWRDYSNPEGTDIVSMTAGSARASFLSLWESINGPRSWDANPWVWVVEFKVVKP